MGLFKQELRAVLVNKDEHIFRQGEELYALCIVIKGRVIATSKYSTMELGAGSVLGLMDLSSDKYCADYKASENTTVIPYFLNSANIFNKIVSSKKEFSSFLIKSWTTQLLPVCVEYINLRKLTESICTFIKDCYDKYKQACKTFFLTPMTIDELETSSPKFNDTLDNSSYEFIAYLKELNNVNSDTFKDFYNSSATLTVYTSNMSLNLAAAIYGGFVHMNDFLLKISHMFIGTDDKNVYALLSHLVSELNKANGDVKEYTDMLNKIEELASQVNVIDAKTVAHAKEYFASSSSGAPQSSKQHSVNQFYTQAEIDKAVSATTNAMEHILHFSGIDDELKEEFKNLVTVFRGTKDKTSSDGEIPKIRRRIADIFYTIYENTFINYMSRGSVPPVIDMFLNYGFVDENLVSQNTIVRLFYLEDTTDSGKYSIYTMKEWLMRIYRMDELPSRNEFDQDYIDCLREMKKTSKMTPAQEDEYLNDRDGRLHFEIVNMFKSVNRLTFGKPSSFCPLLYEGTINGDIDSLILTKEMLVNAFEDVVRIDYSVFHRELIYQNKALGIDREMLNMEILPNIILLPNVGTKAVMWQEVSGVRKNTKGRFMFPQFTRENIRDLAVMVLGKYRWELCRNIQGMHWRDITDKSLTSEFYDYVQFYKKNRDLSNDAKEKLKLQISKSRNSYSDVFIQDYNNWIKYEATGGSKLNKISRSILFRYCPFSKEIRDQLIKFPNFAKEIEMHNNANAQKIRKYENLIVAIKKVSDDVPEEILYNIEFLKK